MCKNVQKMFNSVFSFQCSDYTHTHDAACPAVCWDYTSLYIWVNNFPSILHAELQFVHPHPPRSLPPSLPSSARAAERNTKPAATVEKYIYFSIQRILEEGAPWGQCGWNWYPLLKSADCVTQPSRVILILLLLTDFQLSFAESIGFFVTCWIGLWFCSWKAWWCLC